MTEQTWTQEEVLAEAKRHRQMASETFLKNGEHRPITFLFATKDPRTGENVKTLLMVPVIGTFHENEKQDYSEVIRKLAKETNAVGIIFVTESWMLKTKPGADSEAAMRKWTGRIHQHPDRIEMLNLFCEHVRFGSLIWGAEIKRPPGEPEGKPELGSWEGEDSSFPGFKDGKPTRVEGRFTQMLPQVD